MRNMHAKIDPRSILFIPAHIDKYIDKITQIKSTTIALDLEDSVPTSSKNYGRNLISKLDSPLIGSNSILIRISTLETNSKEFIADIECSRNIAIGYILPKISSAVEVKKIIKKINKLYLKGPNSDEPIYLAFIESFQAMMDIKKIAETDQVRGLIFGHEDYLSTISSFGRGNEQIEDHARLNIIASAKANKILAIDSPYLEIKNNSGYLDYLHKSSSMGFDGVIALTPSQIEQAKSTYMPSKTDIEWAKQIIQLNTEMKNQNPDISISTSENHFIAPPMLKRAYAILVKLNRYNSTT